MSTATWRRTVAALACVAAMAAAGVAGGCTMGPRRAPTEAEAAAPRVARIWRGTTARERADEYQLYLYESGVKTLRTIPRNLGVQMFRRDSGDTSEFTVISYWPDRESIHAYAGSDISKPRHLPRDAEFLLALPDSVQHCDVIVNAWGAGEPAPER